MLTSEINLLYEHEDIKALREQYVERNVDFGTAFDKSIARVEQDPKTNNALAWEIVAIMVQLLSEYLMMNKPV